MLVIADDTANPVYLDDARTGGVSPVLRKCVGIELLDVGDGHVDGLPVFGGDRFARLVHLLVGYVDGFPVIF